MRVSNENFAYSRSNKQTTKHIMKPHYRQQQQRSYSSQYINKTQEFFDIKGKNHKQTTTD